jgi:aldehyde decarbonylase
LVAPWAAYSTYSFASAKLRGEEGDLLSFFVLPTVLLRLLYTQLWISISRHQTARSKHRIVSKSLDFDQVDRERNWYVNILGHFNKHMQAWLMHGVLVHAGMTRSS